MQLKTVLLGLAGALLLALVIETLIVTDREALQAWAEAASGAVEDGDTRRMTELLGPDFRMGTLDRARTVERADRARRDNGVTSIHIELLDLTIDGDEASARGLIKATALGRRWEFETRLEFARFREGWALVAADPVM